MRFLVEGLRRALDTYPFAAHAVALVAFSLVVLTVDSSGSYNALDGQYMRQLVWHQYEWMPFGLDFGPNPLQGMANIFFPFNMNLTPILALQTRLFNGQISVALTFALFSLELSAAAYLLGSLLTKSQPIRFTAAWVLPLLAMPFIWPPIFYPLYAMAPNCVDLIAAEAVLIWAFARLGDGTMRANLFRTAIIVVVPGWISVANPLFVMIIVPTIAVGFLFLLWSSRDKRSLWWRLTALAVMIFAMLAGGFVQFLAGNTFFTTVTFFSKELFRHQSGLFNASVVFQSRVFSFAGAALVAMSMMGAIVAAIREQHLPRTLAIFHLTLTVLLLISGVLLVWFVPSWRGPQMVYFEVSNWPFYCLFAVYGGFAAVNATVRPMGMVHRRVYALSTLFSSRKVQSVAGAVCLVFVFFTAIRHHRSEGLEVPPIPAKTSIVRLLHSSIALQPGAIFRGSVATFAGGDITKAISWFDQAPYDTQLWQSTGNDHRLVGLWYYGIPTLVEYNHYLTPAMYLLFSRMLARQLDPQMRNIMALTMPDDALLQALGVRFVISDRNFESNYQLRETILWNINSRLYLYELFSPNLGNYSPTKVTVVHDATGALVALKRGLDFRHEVVTTEPVLRDLVPASATELQMEKGGFRLRAESPGTSLLLMPIQFSHCLELSQPTNGAAPVRILRANLLQAGILFSGRLDTNISFRSGPFGHAKCRVEDIEDMYALDLAGAAEKFPLLHQDAGS